MTQEVRHRLGLNFGWTETAEERQKQHIQIILIFIQRRALGHKKVGTKYVTDEGSYGFSRWRIGIGHFRFRNMGLRYHISSEKLDDPFYSIITGPLKKTHLEPIYCLTHEKILICKKNPTKIVNKLDNSIQKS